MVSEQKWREQMPQSKRPPPWPTRPSTVAGTPLPFGHDESSSASLTPASASVPRYPTIPREAHGPPHLSYSGAYPHRGAGSPMDYTPTPTTEYLYSPASSYSGVTPHSPAYLPRPAPNPAPLLDDSAFRPPSRSELQRGPSLEANPTAAAADHTFVITPSMTTLKPPPTFRDPSHRLNFESVGSVGVRVGDPVAGTRRGVAGDDAVRDPSKRARRMLPPPSANARNDSAHFVNFGRGVPNVAAPLGRRIFGFLSVTDRSRASRVCRQWNRILSPPSPLAPGAPG
jgi:F-box-like